MHKTRKTEKTVKPVKPVKTVCDKKEDRKENENSGLCNIDYCAHCKLLEMRLRKYAVYIRRKHKNSDLASWCDLFSRHGFAPADYSKIMAVLEDATLIKSALVSRKTFAQRPAGVVPHPGFGVPPNPVLAPRRILEAEKDGAPIRNVPDAPLPDLDSTDVNLPLDAEMQLAPLPASGAHPPGVGVPPNPVLAPRGILEAEKDGAPIRNVPDAPLPDLDSTDVNLPLDAEMQLAPLPASGAHLPGFGVPPNPVLAPRGILEAEKDGAPIRNVPDAPLPDLDSTDVNLPLDAEMQLAPLLASVPPPPGFGALSNLVRAEEQQSAAAPILKVEQVLDAPSLMLT